MIADYDSASTLYSTNSVFDYLDANNCIFQINETGNVGIGTMNPSSKLDVSGNANVTGTMTAATFSGSGASLTNIPNSALTNDKITINNVDVTLGGSFSITGSSQWDDDGSDIYFNSGNVGIGTNNPTTDLDVDGNIKCHGTLTFDHTNQLFLV